MKITAKLSLWSALKLRIAGIHNYIEKERQQETEKLPDVNDIRINKYTGKPEVCVLIERSSTKPFEIIDERWEDYDTNLLSHTLGMCPGGGEIYPLIRFKQKAAEEAKKIKEEAHNHDHNDMLGKEDAEPDHVHRISKDGVPVHIVDRRDWVDRRIEEAEEAGLDPALLF